MSCCSILLVAMALALVIPNPKVLGPIFTLVVTVIVVYNFLSGGKK